MAIISTDIKSYLSGGAANTDPNLSLGGIISTTEIVDNTLHNLYDKITGDEALAGDTEYRGYYVKNTHGTLTLESAKIWIEAQPNARTTKEQIWIALCDEGKNVTMETIADESTAPVGPTFSQPANKAGGLSLGNVAAGERYGIWVKRLAPANTEAKDAAQFQIKVEGDTAE